MFKKSWVADYADEENFMGLFYSRNFTPYGVNAFHYHNPLFDKAFEKALKETDEKERIRLYRHMDSLVTEEACFIPLYYDQVVRIVSHKIKQLTTNPINLLNLKTVTKTQI
jgi:peptide/nickel transport system substrate-binding protein